MYTGPSATSSRASSLGNSTTSDPETHDTLNLEDHPTSDPETHDTLNLEDHPTSDPETHDTLNLEDHPASDLEATATAPPASPVADRPATYREVFAVGEFRALFLGFTLSTLGDMLAKVAITVLVYRDTGSSLLSASAFALGYLPWGLGGPLLSAMADRLPWRRTLIGCDLARAALICLLAVPGVPLPVLLLLLLSSSLLAPPFEAARSALLPEVLPGDRYFVAASLTVVSGYVANVAGFVGGGALVALISARGALLTDAATFAVSAALIALFVRRRPPPEPARTGSLTRDTADGIRLVFGHRVLRSYVLLVWVVSSFVFAGEGLAAPYAAHLGGGPATVGLLLAAIPLGVAIGGLVVTRFTQPSRRAGLVLPLAAVSTLALSPLIFDPPLIVVLTLYVISGAGLACAVPLNAMFVRSVASTFRGRAFGVARTGLEIGQGLAILVAGVLAVVLPVSLVIALLAGVSGTLGVLLLGLRWPSSGAQNDAQEHPISGVGIPARHSATLRTPDRMR